MTRQSYSSAIRGHEDPNKPFSLVVRYGTRGETRDQTVEEILSKNLGGPYATKDEALVAKAQISRHLQPFTDISTFKGWI